MSIYQRKGIDFDSLLSVGQKWEQIFIDYLNSKENIFAYKVSKEKGYDIEYYKTDDPKREIRKIEVKAHSGVNKRTGYKYDTFFAEIVQNIDINSIPEYLTIDIDYVIHINVAEEMAYIFDHKKYKEYVLERKDQAYEAMYATSSGIKISWTNKQAGYLGKAKLV